MNQRVLVWDSAVRIFHILFAVGFAASYGIAKLLGEDSQAFPYHAIIGLMLSLLVALRVVWALIGTRWARFTGLSLGPKHQLSYLASIVSGKGPSYAGHNPATSFAMLLMFAGIGGLAWTGLQMGQGNESSKDLHELFANGVLALALAHILGVLLHSVRHRDGIVVGMLDGKKQVDPAQGIRSSAVPAAVVGVLVLGFFGTSLLSTYDPASQSATVPVLGTRLQLGESEGEGQAGSEHEEADDD